MRISKKSSCNTVVFNLTAAEKNKVIKDMCTTACRSFTDYARKKLLDTPLTVLYRNKSYDEFTEAYLDFKKDLYVIQENELLHPGDQEWLKERIDVLINTVIKLYTHVRQSRMENQLQNTLNYNENKVRQGSAELLSAENFLLPGDLMTREDKLARFEQRNSLYEGKTRMMVPIIISFDVQEAISNEKMTQAANRYMAAIGYDRQPYLVYRHQDTAHPHCHVVTTAVSREGEILYLSPATLWKSHRLCRVIERDYGLAQWKDVGDGEVFRVRQAQRVTSRLWRDGATACHQ